MTIANTNHRRLSTGEYDLIDASLAVVDQIARDMEAKWGLGRLPYIVPIEWAERFRSQQRKLTDACFSRVAADVKRHAEAMVRAYAKIEEIALAAGEKPLPPEQWEFDTPEGLVILIRDVRQSNLVERGGRQCQVWSLDEIANVLRSYPVLAAAKTAFPGAVVESIRPAIRATKEALNDDLADLPF